MGDINLRTKIDNLDERVSKVEESGGDTNTPILVDLGSITASSYKDFFSKCFSQMASKPNGVYMATSTYFGNTAMLLTIYKVSNTRMIGTAIPQPQNSRYMYALGYESGTIYTYSCELTQIN